MAAPTPLSWVHKIVARFAYSRAGLWLVSRVARPLDRATVKLTGGRHTLISLLAGLPACMVTTTGAKSGLPRATPLVVIPDGGRFLLVGSNFGGQRSPGWYYNLKAHPVATLTCQGQSRRYRARELAGAEYDRAWALASALFPGYVAYRRRASHRHIPLLELVEMAGEDDGDLPRGVV